MSASPVENTAWDGEGMLNAFVHAAATLRSRVDEVNALNVFPVPDGDTGSNMLATVQAAITEAEAVPAAERSVPRIAAALSFGALMGARGNSGVILSQVFRGMGEAVAASHEVGGAELVSGFEKGCKAAFAAVAVPVEGTMLTVIRDASEAAAKAAKGNGELEHVLSAAVFEAAASVERTPSLLAVLRRAGVVDAGGRGIEILLRGALSSLRGEDLPKSNGLPADLN
ncbi:MAG: DAK2 domain-containing protein, partial [Chloroflexota bacterium]